jgi:hypothetical protein
VLVQSDNFGFWEYPDNKNLTQFNTTEAKFLSDTLTAIEYARNCYVDNPNTRQCKSLRYSSYFMGCECQCFLSICQQRMPIQQTKIISNDTGPINSHYHLGINAAKGNRVTYRKVTTCAPLNISAFSVVEDDIPVSIPGLGNNVTTT